MRLSRRFIRLLSPLQSASVALVILTFCLEPCGAEDAVWQFEKQRIEAAVCAGDFRKALELAETFDKEFEKAKRSPRNKGQWQVYEWVAIDVDLLVGSIEHMCGNYPRARGRFERALAELKQVRQRNLRAFAAVSAREQQTRGAGTWLKAAAVDERSFTKYLAGEVQHQIAGQAALAAERASDVVYQTESRMVMVYGALGSLSIDSALPLRAQSMKSLKDAERFFRAAQEIVEASQFDIGGERSRHGTNQVSFFVNYGNTYLKQAESLTHSQRLGADDDGIEPLLERSADYLKRAEQEFSAFKEFVDKFKEVVGNYDISELKDQIVNEVIKAQSGDNKGVSRSAVSRVVDNAFVKYQLLCLGDADISFKQSELAITRIRCGDAGKATPIESQERTELYDEAEQRLLDAADKIKLISERADHPFLVVCYSQLAALEASRAVDEKRQPDPRYKDFLDLSDKIMKAKDLAAESVQGVYLSTAKQLWDTAMK